MYKMKLLTIKATSNRTTRFTLLGKQGFYRLRKIKKRYGIDRGDCFNQLHVGKFTIALQRKKGRKLFGFAFNA
jgi:hypothetical protein